MLSAGELFVLAGLILALYAALRPLRRWLEARFTRLFGGGSRRREGRVVVLGRRGDGKFGREEGGHGRDG